MLVEQPVLAPSRCMRCERHAGAMLDMMFRSEDPASSPYLCLYCAADVVREIGGLDPQQADELRQKLKELFARVGELEEQLAEARGSQTISLDDAEAMIRQRIQTVVSPNLDYDPGPIVKAWEERAKEEVKAIEARTKAMKQCAQIKDNGKRCQAVAATGAEYCELHERKRRQLERGRAKREAEQQDADGDQP